jgi:hypothetical protein
LTAYVESGAITTEKAVNFNLFDASLTISGSALDIWFMYAAVPMRRAITVRGRTLRLPAYRQ